MRGIVCARGGGGFVLSCCEDLPELEEEHEKGKLRVYGRGGERRDISVYGVEGVWMYDEEGAINRSFDCRQIQKSEICQMEPWLSR